MASAPPVVSVPAAPPAPLPPAPEPEEEPEPTPAPESEPQPAPPPAPPPPAPAPGSSDGSCDPNCAAVAPPEGFVVTPKNDQPQRSASDDAEYRQNYTAAEYINALFALDNNWIGQGVLVGVMDDGINAVGDLAGTVNSSLSRDFGYIETNGNRRNRSDSDRIGDDESDHGTLVAGIIAARDDGEGIQGLAPGATLVSLRVTAERDGQKIWGVGRDDALRHAANSGIPIVNMSLARRPGTRPSESFMDAVEFYNRRAKGLLVAAAGNNSQATSGSAVEVDTRYAESWLFVAALETNGTDYELADYSNRCGTLMQRCVVAPALNRSINASGNFQTFGGTSSATPVVSSVAAMILSKWPQLTGVDAGNIILNSALDLGAPGVDAIYGHGLVDVEAALSPVNPVLSNGISSASVDGAVMVVGDAFGGIVSASIGEALNQVTVLDDYGRDFSGDLSSMVVQPAPAQGGLMQRRVEAQANARNAGFVSPAGSVAVGVTAFDTGLRDTGGVPVLRNALTFADFNLRVSDTVSLTGGFNSDNNVMADVMGLAPTSDVMLAYSPLAQTSVGVKRRVGGTNVGVSIYSGEQGEVVARGALAQIERGAASVKLGLIDEAGSVFGTPTGVGVLRFGDGARTYFIEATSVFNLGKFSLDGFASFGATRLKLSDDTLLTQTGVITTGRYGFTISREALGGRMSLGLAQPLLVLSGNATFTVGERYDLATRGLQFQDRRVDLSGSMAPQFTFGYEKRTERSDFRIGAASDAQAQDVRGVASWNLRFGGG